MIVTKYLQSKPCWLFPGGSCFVALHLVKKSIDAGNNFLAVLFISRSGPQFVAKLLQQGENALGPVL
jgi:hypothetical protein